MSSFNSRVARAKKEKGGQSNAESGKGRGKKEEVTVIENTTVVEEHIDPVRLAESTTEEDIEHAEELYGEDQGEQSKPKWQRDIPLDRIRPNPFQPRKIFDPVKLNELAEGMKEHGWIGGGLPVRAATDEPNVYELVWGERRWRAAKIAALNAIPCVISAYSDEDMIEKGLLENIQREDLSNLEEGQAYVNLLALRTEQGKPRYSIRRLAARIGKDKSYIEERLKYARVPVDIQQLAVDQPDISPRIIHELGELAKVLKPEERAPVIEGVREGRLRIEDVHEIRKDIEQKQTHTTNEPTAPIEQRPGSTTLPTAAPVAIATNTPPSSTTVEERQPEEIGQEKVRLTAQATVPVPQQPTPMTTTIAVSVFEKMLKRDNEALERIIQRIIGTFEALTTDEQNVLRQYVQRWNTSLQDLMTRIEQPLASEEVE